MTPEQRKTLEKFCRDAEQGSLVSSMKQALEFMEKSGLCWQSSVKPQMLGVHHLNRDGLGIDVSHMQELLTSVCQMGWDPASVHPICVEVPAGDEQAFWTFNKRLADESMGKLPCPERPLKYATISASHTNMMMKSLLASCKHPQGCLTDGNGHLMMASVPLALQEACKSGLAWTVLSAAVAEVTMLIPLLQSSMNATHQVAKGETELQVAMKIASAIKTRGKAQLSWNDVQQEVLRSRPRCATACPSIFMWVAKYAAGDKMKATEAFIRSNGHPSKELGPGSWEVLAQEYKGDQRLWWRHAILKFAYASAERVWLDSDVAWI